MGIHIAGGLGIREVSHSGARLYLSSALLAENRLAKVLHFSEPPSSSSQY